MYHSVSPDVDTEVAPYFRLTTSPARFMDHMRWLREGGYEVVDLSRALRELGHGISTERLVVLTFDDGFHDFISFGWPILQTFGVTATVFLPTNYIDDNRRVFKGRPCLTWNEVRQLHAHGVTFGSHTVTHAVLYRLGWEAIRFELAESRRRIEDEIGAPVDHFAYPYAFPQEDRPFVSKVAELIRASGYRSGVTTVVGRCGVASNPFCLHRIPINDEDDRELFLSKLCGAYDWVGSAQRLVRSAKRGVRFLRSGFERQHD